jgi:CheY-like chemotaxis protein
MLDERRLLVVDDEPANGRLVEAVARELGYSVRLTSQVADFQREFAAFAPTVVVVDIVMPDSDGIEVVQWLAAQATPARVVLATGYDLSYAKAAEMIGVNKGLTVAAVLSKPFSLEELRGVLA